MANQGNKLRAKLPSKSPLFVFQLRDRVGAQVHREDEDHVVLEFATAEEAAALLQRSPLNIQGHTLELEPVATERNATPPGASSISRLSENLESALRQSGAPAQPSREGGASETGGEDTAPAGSEAIKARLSRMGALPTLGLGNSKPPLPLKPPLPPKGAGRGATSPGQTEPSPTPAAAKPPTAEVPEKEQQKSAPPVVPRKKGPESSAVKPEDGGGSSASRPVPARRRSPPAPGKTTSPTEEEGRGTAPRVLPRQIPPAAAPPPGAGAGKDVSGEGSPGPLVAPRRVATPSPPVDVPASRSPPPDPSPPPRVAQEPAPTPEAAPNQGILMWKSSDFLDDKDSDDVPPSGTNEAAENDYLQPEPPNDKRELLAGGGGGGEPSSDFSLVSDHTYAEIDERAGGNEEALFATDELSIPKERAPPPPRVSPPHRRRASPPDSAPTPATRPRPSPGQGGVPVPPSRPLPELPIGGGQLEDDATSSHVYTSLHPPSSFDFSQTSLDYPSLDMSAQLTPPAAAVAATTASDDAWEVLPTWSSPPEDVLGAGANRADDDDDDGDDMASKFDYDVPLLPPLSGSDLDDIGYQDIDEAQLFPADHGRVRERVVLTGRRAERQDRAVDPARGGEREATGNTGPGRGDSDDSEDDEENDEGGPIELGVFLRQKSEADRPRGDHAQNAGAGQAGEEGRPESSISQQLSLPALTLKLLEAGGRLVSRPGVRVQHRGDGKVFLEGEEGPVLQMEREMRLEGISLRPTSRFFSEERLAVLGARRQEAEKALAGIGIRDTWAVHDGQVHVTGANSDLLLDVLQNFCDEALPSAAARMPEAAPSPSRHAQTGDVVTESLKLEEVLLDGSARGDKMEEAFQFLTKNQRNLFGNLAMQCDDPDLTLTLAREDGCHWLKVTGQRAAVADATQIVRIHLEDITQVERVLRDEAVTRVWKNGQGQEVIRRVEELHPNYVVTAEALAEESSRRSVSGGAGEMTEEEIHNSSGSDASSDDSSEDEISNVHTRTPSPQPAAVAQGSVLHVLPAMDVRKGDLLKQDVDAIVHGTDPQLTFSTNLGKALLQAEGASLQQTCTDFVQQEGRLPVGATFCTTARTQSKFTTVVHASLPKTTSGRTDGQLRDTVVAALKAAKAKGHHTVALPALGVKSCGFSPVDSVLSVIQGVAAFALADPAHGLHHVALCDVSEDTHQVFQAVLPEVWALDMEVLRASLQLHASLLLADSQLQNPRSHVPHVQLVLGSIQNQEADVIVNSTRADLNLASGSISKSLAGAAGARLQQEARAQCPQGLAAGKLCVTSGGQLPCKAIFHVMLPAYKGEEEVKVLKATVTQCLDDAERGGHSSIAFPPLGTGVLNFPSQVVMATILNCVALFRQRHRNPSLKCVTIVAYPRDLFAVQELRRTMAEFIRTGKTAAKAAPVSHRFNVGNVTVEMLQGDITRERTDAIVNGCQDDMNLDKGILSKAVLQAAGPQLQTECSKLASAMAKDKVVVSGPGKLGCKKIIHVLTQAGLDHWKAVWPKVFETCKRQKLTSLSIPPIGTGNMKVSPKEMGALLCEVMKKMASLGSLTTVRVIFLDQSKQDEFARGFMQQLGSPGRRAPPPVPAMATEEVTLGSLRVTVALGDITTETTSAIVNFCSPDLNLSHGVLPSTILKAAGPDLQKECSKKKAAMNKDGVVVTGSGKLKCRKVIHVTRADSAARLADAVKRAVLKASSEELSHISLPAPSIGGRFEAVQVAGAMFEGLRRAGSTGGTPVHVRLVLVKPADVGAFVQQLRGQTLTSPPPFSLSSPRMRRQQPGSTFPRSARRRGMILGRSSFNEDIFVTSYTVPVRVRVTGMDAVGLQRALKAVQDQCKRRVVSHLFTTSGPHGDTPGKKYRTLQRLPSASRVSLIPKEDGVEVLGTEDDIRNVQAELDQLALE